MLLAKAAMLLAVVCLLISIVACSAVGGAANGSSAPGTAGNGVNAPETVGNGSNAPETAANESTAPEMTTPETAAPGTTAPESAGPVTVTDQAGREVVIGGDVQRIVSGYYISSSVCIALGLADKLVGIEARANERPIYALAKPELMNLTSVGTARDFNLEACLELKPDLAILPARLRDVAETMEEMGVPVILVNPESYRELIEMIALIGQATRETQRASQLIDWIENSRKSVESLTASLSDKPVVYMCGTDSWLTTTPNDMFQASLIELAGGRNAAGGIAGSGRIEISYEQLLLFDPEIIIIPPEAGFTIDDVLADPLLTELSAVRTRSVYHMPDAFEAWDSPVPSFMLGVKWLLSVLYEDGYSIETLRLDASDYYMEFYGFIVDTALIS